MRDVMRFASLRGQARKWAEAEFDEIEERVHGSESTAVSEMEHDGWSPIMPRKRYVRVADLVRAQRMMGSSANQVPPRERR